MTVLPQTLKPNFNSRPNQLFKLIALDNGRKILPHNLQIMTIIFTSKILLTFHFSHTQLVYLSIPSLHARHLAGTCFTGFTKMVSCTTFTLL
jgi:hypothetical protein